jgi:hypothetical protein
MTGLRWSQCSAGEGLEVTDKLTLTTAVGAARAEVAQPQHEVAT